MTSSKAYLKIYIKNCGGPKIVKMVIELAVKYLREKYNFNQVDGYFLCGKKYLTFPSD